jgi:cytochrome oxidase Cu insertion factor (SCO1/SenC/PrrC family)
MGRIKMLLVLLVCAAPVLASYFMYFVVRPDARSNYATLIVPTRTLPALSLRDADGKAVSASALKGQWVLLVVGPADCDAACEKRLFLQRQLREMLGRERDRIDKVWLVTGDAAPAAALRVSLGDDPAMQVLHADRAELAAWLAPEPGHALEEHLYLVDPHGEWMLRAPVDAQPAKLKRDLDRLLRASGSWDRAGR